MDLDKLKLKGRKATFFVRGHCFEGATVEDVARDHVSLVVTGPKMGGGEYRTRTILKRSEVVAVQVMEGEA